MRESFNRWFVMHGLTMMLLVGCGSGTPLKLRGLKHFTVEFQAPFEGSPRAKLADEVVHIEIAGPDGVILSQADMGLDEVWGNDPSNPQSKNFVSLSLPLLTFPKGPLHQCKGMSASFTVRIKEESKERYDFFKKEQHQNDHMSRFKAFQDPNYQERRLLVGNRSGLFWRTLIHLKVNLYDGTSIPALPTPQKPTELNGLDPEQRGSSTFNLSCPLP